MKRALVLRARQDALTTKEKLRALGYKAVISPVLDIVATGAEVPAGAYDAMLASSAKGVESVGDSPAFEGLALHAVGAKTAAAARLRGWAPDIVAGNAEAILPQLLALYRTQAHFLYLAGRDRQPMLEAGLAAAGHRVTAVNVYEARAASSLTPEALTAISAGSIDVALHYSRRSVAIFLSLIDAAALSDRLHVMDHLALSGDVALPLRARGLAPQIAPKPDEAGLLDLLQTGEGSQSA